MTNKDYAPYEEFCNKLFNRLFLPIEKRNDENSNPANFVTYSEKVKKYTKFIIGRKIPKNAPKYSEEEI